MIFKLGRDAIYSGRRVTVVDLRKYATRDAWCAKVYPVSEWDNPPWEHKHEFGEWVDTKYLKPMRASLVLLAECAE